MEIWFTLGENLRHAFLAVILIRAATLSPILQFFPLFSLPSFCNRVTFVLCQCQLERQIALQGNVKHPQESL